MMAGAADEVDNVLALQFDRAHPGHLSGFDSVEDLSMSRTGVQLPQRCLKAANLLSI
jgi:hypothetical protein